MLLGPTLRGEMLWAQGYSEPGAGSDLASLQTRAIRDGDEYVINGQKMWTSSAHKSNWLFGMFRTDPDAPKHRGITFMVMEMRQPEISVRPIVAMDWRHATNETFFEDMRVPVDQVIGEVNRGWYVGMTLLDFERSGISGAAGQRETIAATVEAIQDGSIPNRVSQVRTEIAERAIEVEVNNNLAMRIASMQASGLIPNYEASMGKAFTTELSQRLAHTGMKTFGLYSGLWGRRRRARTAALGAHAHLRQQRGRDDRGRILGDPAQHHRDARAGAASRLALDPNEALTSEGAAAAPPLGVAFQA